MKSEDYPPNSSATLKKVNNKIRPAENLKDFEGKSNQESYDSEKLNKKYSSSDIIKEDAKNKLG